MMNDSCVLLVSSNWHPKYHRTFLCLSSTISIFFPFPLLCVAPAGRRFIFLSISARVINVLSCLFKKTVPGVNLHSDIKCIRVSVCYCYTICICWCQYLALYFIQGLVSNISSHIVTIAPTFLDCLYCTLTIHHILVFFY